MKQLCQTLRAVLLFGILTIEVLASSNTGDYCQSNCGNIVIYCRDVTTFTLRVTLGHGFGLILDKSLHCPTGYYCQEDDKYPCVSYQTTAPINEYTSEGTTQIITEFDTETTANWIHSSEISTKAPAEDSSTQMISTITNPEDTTTTILYSTTQLTTDLNANDVKTTDFSDYTTTEIDVEVTQGTTFYVTNIDEESTIIFSEITTIGSTVDQTADYIEVSTEQATTQLPVITSTIKDTPVTTEAQIVTTENPTETTAEFAESTEEIRSTTELYTIEDETSLPPLTQTISTTTSSLVESTTADNMDEWTLTPITSDSGTTLNTGEESEPTPSSNDNNTTTLKPSSIEHSTEGIEYTSTEQIITTIPITEEISLEVTSSTDSRNTASVITETQSSIITITPIDGTMLNTVTEVPTITRTSVITTTRAPTTKTTVPAVLPPITTPRPGVLRPVCNTDGYHRATACHQYWDCVRPYWWAWWFEAVLKTCSPGRFFSTEFQPCNYPPKVHCYF